MSVSLHSWAVKIKSNAIIVKDMNILVYVEPHPFQVKLYKKNKRQSLQMTHTMIII